MRLRFTIALLVIVALVSIGTTLACVWLLSRMPGMSKQEDGITYGTFAGYFAGQDQIAYPEFLSDISIMSDAQGPSIKFGPKLLRGFQMTMIVSQKTKAGAKNLKQFYLDRGWTHEGTLSTPNGYVGDFFISDNRAHPEAGLETCNFSRSFIVPLSESDRAIILQITAEDSGWGIGHDHQDCRIFQDENYNILKGVMDHVIHNFQPAF